jgi:hypothetical protein
LETLGYYFSKAFRFSVTWHAIQTTVTIA